MKNYRYSEVLRDFYRILIPVANQERLDIHFTGGSHHFYMAKYGDNSRSQDYHLELLHQHMAALKLIVFREGDFSQAKDPSLRNLNKKESWAASNRQFPHPNMFDSMRPDPTCGVGQPHSCDFFLENCRPSGMVRSAKKNGQVYSH